MTSIKAPSSEGEIGIDSTNTVDAFAHDAETLRPDAAILQRARDGSYSLVGSGIHAELGASIAPEEDPRLDQPIGYCWPGHREIESKWTFDQGVAYSSLLFSEGEVIQSTLGEGEYWSRHGDGQARRWHSASAAQQLGRPAVAAYGAIASCLGTTKWWISYKTDRTWKWALDGWECPAGGVGFWKVPPTVTRRRILGVPTNRYRYRQFDIKFRAESEDGAFHRYFVGFAWFPDQTIF